MILDSHEPISETCARTVEPAVASLFRLGFTQQEVVSHLSRALGIVHAVRDYHQSIPCSELATLGRTFWARLPQIPELSLKSVQLIRSVILDCVGALRRLPESNGPPTASESAAGPENGVSMQQKNGSPRTLQAVPQLPEQVTPVRTHGSRGLFGWSEPERPAFRRANGFDQPFLPARRQATRDQPTLFDYARNKPARPEA